MAVAIALVLAQDAFPAWPGFHTWQYAVALGLISVPLARGLRGAARAPAIAATLGTFIVLVAGLCSGLLGPDTQIVSRSPGTVAPLPDVGAAAFFPNAGAADIESGSSAIVLRRRDGPPVVVAPGNRRFLSATELEAVSRPAAYVDARDARGDRLTITQPTNPAFLSPVLLFPQQVTIGGTRLPADGFALPAAHRQIKAFYFSKADSEAARSRGMAGVESVLFAVDDDAGRAVPDGIGFARTGQAISLGGARLVPTIGRYPALAISAVPYPPALIVGCLLCAAALILSFTAKQPKIVS